MAKNGTTAEGNPFEYDEIAAKLARQFSSQGARSLGPGIDRFWMKEKVSESFEQLRAASGVGWRRWSCFDKDSDEAQRELNDY